jgi:uncharacterized protein YfaP (DUF2135 family)
MVLQWGESPLEVDAHLTGPLPPESRFHVFYADPGSQTASPFAALDRDDQDSFGPETITISDQFAGTYASPCTTIPTASRIPAQR